MATTVMTAAKPKAAPHAHTNGSSSSSSAATRTSASSTHILGESVHSLCFLTDVRNSNGTSGDGAADADLELLPLLAVGGGGAISLHLPVVATADEDALRREFAPSRSSASAVGACSLRAIAEIAHDGDATALRYITSTGLAGGGSGLLVSASSSGSVHAFRLGGAADNADANSVLAPVATPQWTRLFARAATAMDADGVTLVVAAECGELAWLRVDEAGVSARKVGNRESSRLALNAVKMLSRDSVVATAGAAPGAQLRGWDVNAHERFPVATAADPHATCALTSLETHPTRPELLFTGSDDGRVALWDLRRLDAPLRVDARHQKAVRALALHESSPRLLFSGGADATVLAWDFHHGRPHSHAVEYSRHVHPLVQPVAAGFLPWTSLALHAASDTLVAGSDAQSLLLVRRASRALHA